MFTVESMKAFRQANRILFRGSNVLYLLPHPRLRSWISNYTITFPQAEAMSEQYTVIPHGCATLVYACDTREIKSNLFGPITKPSCVGHDANSASLLFIVEFQPAGYYAFSKIPQFELTDLLIPFGNLDSAFDRDIEQSIEGTTDLDDFITAVDTLFFSHLKDLSFPQEFSAANDLILKNNGVLSIKDLSQNVYYSERHLSRTFNKYVGTSTKSFSRLVRINKALHILRRPNISIIRAGMESGFYDDPHFIRDFTSICGITPQKYRDHMSDFYSELAKF
ncbi:MAG: helix-turn-helix transcriptional regulator [bacterium]|nr:helix-turn-helix transcriptional regulator [bacterium]